MTVAASPSRSAEMLHNARKTVPVGPKLAEGILRYTKQSGARCSLFGRKGFLWQNGRSWAKCSLPTAVLPESVGPNALIRSGQMLAPDGSAPRAGRAKCSLIRSAKCSLPMAVLPESVGPNALIRSGPAALTA